MMGASWKSIALKLLGLAEEYRRLSQAPQDQEYFRRRLLHEKIFEELKREIELKIS